MISMGSNPDLTFLIPNGLTSNFLENAKPSFERRRSGYRGDGTIGYFGHLTENWFNWQLLLKTASRRPDLRFEIIGFGAPKDMNLPPNVKLLGEKTHNQIIDIASNWSVAIIPFKNTKLAEGVDPIKIYEYFALGLPCVSCWMPQIKDYPLTFTYRDDADFEKLIDKVMKFAQSAEAWTRTEDFVTGSTWDKRVQTTLSLARIDNTKRGS
jgi:glycosyltransferase involved in cell wall biosynthesis